MLVALSFVGTLPSYVVDCIYQVRLFFDGPIVLMVSDVQSPYLPLLDRVRVVDTRTVASTEFDTLLKNSRHRFNVIDGLKDRKHLFSRSFERFFLLSNLMKRDDLSDVLFIELDNLLYDDPRQWLPRFSKYQLAYLFDNYNRCSAGIMYVKQPSSLDGFLKFAQHYIQHAQEFINEMSCLYQYYQMNQHSIYILPTHWKEPAMASQHFGPHGNTIFDALGIGCMLFGLDDFHTQGVNVRGKKAPWCYIDYTVYPVRWEKDSKQRKIPSMWTGKQWVRINNLHIHSKLLKEGLSIPRIT